MGAALKDDEPNIESSSKINLYKIREKRKKSSVRIEESESNWLVSYADMMTLLVGFFIILQSYSKIDTNEFEKIRKETIRVFGGEYKIPFETLSNNLKSVIKSSGVGDQVIFTDLSDGVQISFRGNLFFESGSSELRTEANQLMAQIIPILSEEAKDFSVLVEGHTDDVPVSSAKYPSNWELSSVRSCAVIRLFENAGFDRKKLRAMGWGDTRPLVQNRSPAGESIPENQAVNRRVVIKILKNAQVEPY